MIHLEKSQYPKDFYYHRTASETYRKYLVGCHISPFDIGNTPQFAWKKRIFGDYFGIVKYERIDTEPDIEYIKQITGLKHAFVVWIPYSRTDKEIPRGWRHLWLTDHFEETGFSLLPEKKEGEDESSQKISVPYTSSWNDRAKRARKKFFSLGCRVVSTDPETFAGAFLRTKVRHWFKGDYVRYFRTMSDIDATKLRQWLAYDPEGNVIGGLAVHDFCGTHSVHLVAFTDQKGYQYQPGTGLIDEWFRSSYAMGLRYLSFDQLRNRHGPRDQKGYTEFKENFLSARLSFRKAYFRFF